MTDNLPATTPSKKTTEPHGLVLNGPLNFWLLVETSDAKAIETIAKSDILRKEAAELMPALKAEALKPATEDQIKAIISQRFPLFPQPRRNDAEWAAWWADYMDALSGLTESSIEAGMAAWVKSPDAEFMCKPGKLLDLAKSSSSSNRWSRAHLRASTATREARVFLEQPSDPTPQADRPTRDQIAAIMKPVTDKLRSMDPLTKAELKRRPPPCAKVDERGMSAEMRALIERQRIGA